MGDVPSAATVSSKDGTNEVAGSGRDRLAQQLDFDLLASADLLAVGRYEGEGIGA